MSCQIVWIGDNHAPDLANLASDQGRTRWLTDTHGNVHALFDEIDDTVEQQHLGGYAGLRLKSVRHDRRQNGATQCNRCGHGQVPCGHATFARDFGFFRFQIRKEHSGTLQEQLSRFGQAYSPRRSQKKLASKALLESCYGARHGRWRDIQARCCSREPGRFCNSNKDPQLVKAVPALFQLL